MILFLVIIGAILWFVFMVIEAIREVRRKTRVLRVWIRRQETLAEITLYRHNFPNCIPSRIHIEIQRLERRQHHYERHLGRLKFKWKDEEWIEEYLREADAHRWGYYSH